MGDHVPENHPPWSTSLTTRHGEFRVMSFQDTYQGQLHLALVRGEIDRERPTLVRVQAIETLRDALGCDSEGTPLQWNLERSLAHIAAVGTGVLVLLAQHESPEATLEQLRLHGAGRDRTARGTIAGSRRPPGVTRTGTRLRAAAEGCHVLHRWDPL